jgi:hypothetical protein
VPWTLHNLAAVAEGKRVDGGALEGSVGRRLVTNFVVPLPFISGTGRLWNMSGRLPVPGAPRRIGRRPAVTQCVQLSNQRCLLREARRALEAAPEEPLGDYRKEMQTVPAGPGRPRWPVYLSITFPENSPYEWRGIVGSRLMSTLLPQLESSGLFARPLCVDTPAYVVLLWPMDALWVTQARNDALLPIRERVLPCLFSMMETAFLTLWPRSVAGGDGRDAGPRLVHLLPDLDLHLCDL